MGLRFGLKLDWKTKMLELDVIGSIELGLWFRCMNSIGDSHSSVGCQLGVRYFALRSSSRWSLSPCHPENQICVHWKRWTNTSENRQLSTAPMELKWAEFQKRKLGEKKAKIWDMLTSKEPNKEAVSNACCSYRSESSYREELCRTQHKAVRPTDDSKTNTKTPWDQLLKSWKLLQSLITSYMTHSRRKPPKILRV